MSERKIFKGWELTRSVSLDVFDQLHACDAALLGEPRLFLTGFPCKCRNALCSRRLFLKFSALKGEILRVFIWCGK